MTSSARHFRLCVLGAKGVGKTAIIVRYLTRRFIGEYRSQIDMSYHHVISFANKTARIEILDFSPKNEEDLMPGAEVSTSDCFLVVFSIADRQSFLKAVNIVSVLRSYVSSSATPLILLGNKKDLDHSRQVSMEELENISWLLRCDYAEVSVAESSEEIFPVIFGLVKRILSPDPMIDRKSRFSKARDDDKKTKHVEHSAKSGVDSHHRNMYSLHVPDDTRTSKDKRHAYEQQNDSLSHNNSLLSIGYGKSMGVNDECQICCQIHRYRTVSLRDPEASRSYKLPELSLKKIKPWNHTSLPGNQTSLVRAHSLQGREKEGKYDTNSRKVRKCKKGTTKWIREKSSLQERPQTSVKKDFKSSSCLVSCNSKGTEDVDQTFYYHNKAFKGPPFKKGTRDTVSPFARGRSLISPDPWLANHWKDDKSKENFNLKPPNGSRKSLSSKLPSNELSCKSYPSKKLSLDALNSKENRTALHEQFQSNSLFVAETDNSDDSNFTTPKSLTAFNSSSFQGLDKMDKRHFDAYVPVSPSLRVPEKRERKLGVFGKGVLGHVFSKTSLPDLPRATANLYTKFDSLKRTIQKRSL